MKYTIPQPCVRTSWTALAGDDCKRHCEHCDTPVYALDQFSGDELLQIQTAAGGKLCGMLAGESAPVPRSRRAVMVGALLTAISPLMAQTGRVRIAVKDSAGAAINFAKVTLFGRDGTEPRQQDADSNGATVWTGLPVGENLFRVTAKAFNARMLTVVVGGETEQRIDVQIEVEIIGSVSVVGDTQMVITKAPTLTPAPPHPNWLMRLFRITPN